MSFDEILDAGIRHEAYQSMRMLAYTIIFVGVVLSPIAVLSAFFYGWKALEYLVIR